jgi:hypothetical protein
MEIVMNTKAVSPSINQNQLKIIVFTLTPIILAVFILPKLISSEPPDYKSVAWYTANIRDARLQNQICHDKPEIRDNEECINSLHALEISFKGGN